MAKGRVNHASDEFGVCKEKDFEDENEAAVEHEDEYDEDGEDPAFLQITRLLMFDVVERMIRLTTTRTRTRMEVRTKFRMIMMISMRTMRINMIMIITIVMLI